MNAGAKLQRQYVSEVELEALTGIRKKTWQKHRLHGGGPVFYRLFGTVKYDLA
jgi:hypothetical protein